jgi:hypothetical protein
VRVRVTDSNFEVSKNAKTNRAFRVGLERFNFDIGVSQTARLCQRASRAGPLDHIGREEEGLFLNVRVAFRDCVSRHSSRVSLCCVGRARGTPDAPPPGPLQRDGAETLEWPLIASCQL